MSPSGGIWRMADFAGAALWGEKNPAAFGPDCLFFPKKNSDAARIFALCF